MFQLCASPCAFKRFHYNSQGPLREPDARRGEPVDDPLLPRVQLLLLSAVAVRHSLAEVPLDRHLVDERRRRATAQKVLEQLELGACQIRKDDTAS